MKKILAAALVALALLITLAAPAMAGPHKRPRGFGFGPPDRTSWAQLAGLKTGSDLDGWLI